MQVHPWFLDARERAHPGRSLVRDQDWTDGNHVEALVHGATYFSRLAAELEPLGPGDLVCLADWRGDDDEKLTDDGPTLATVLTGLARRGVDVRGLLWRSHPAALGFNEEEQTELARIVVGGRWGGASRRAGAARRLAPSEARRGDPSGRSGSRRRVRRRDRSVPWTPRRWCPSRRPPGPAPRSAVRRTRTVARRPGGGAQVPRSRSCSRRSASGGTTRRRSSGEARPSAGCGCGSRTSGPSPIRSRRSTATPGPRGSHAVQVLRTYPARRPGYPFAPEGERTIARFYRKAFARARSLLYIEDQYFWSREVGEALAGALRANPDLRVIVVVPRFPDRDGLITGPAHLIGTAPGDGHGARRRRRPRRRLRHRERARDADLRPREGGRDRR